MKTDKFDDVTLTMAAKVWKLREEMDWLVKAGPSGRLQKLERKAKQLEKQITRRVVG